MSDNSTHVRIPYESPSLGIQTIIPLNRVLAGSPLDHTATNEDYQEEQFNW